MTSYTYDAFGRIISVSDAENGVTSATYDNIGNILSITDPNGGTTAYKYDSMNRMTESVNAIGSKNTYTYNAQGLLAQSKNARNQSTTYTYDALGRITSATDALGTISYTYDANGNILTVTDENGNTADREYDCMNRVTKYTDFRGNVVKYGYDTLGNLVTLEYAGGRIVRYSYYPTGRLKSVVDWNNRTTNYEYDGNGRLTKLSRPDGSVETYQYDAIIQLWDKHVFKGQAWDDKSLSLAIEGVTFGITAILSAKNLGETFGNIRNELNDIKTSQCFVEGTLIVTADGDRPIEEIQAGDLVYSTNPETGESEYKEVLRTFRKESDVLIHIFVNGEEIQTTPVHPFWVEDQWVAAKDLEAGDILTLADGSTAPVTDTYGEKLDEPVIVYNFEVADFHTYYVTDTGVLVHNASKYVDDEVTITKSDHAEIRGQQGRNVNTAINDVNRAKPSNIYLQDDGRYVVKGSNGRVHIFEPDGELVTTMNNVTNFSKRVSSGRYSPLTEAQKTEFANKFGNYLNNSWFSYK